MNVPILILAAGASSRMRGVDKLAEPLAGVPMLRRIVLRAMATDAPVFVALPAAPHSRDGLIGDLDVTIVRCPDAANGMAVSLKQAVQQLPSCRRFLLLAADLPDLETADLRAVLRAPAVGDDNLIWRGTTEDGKPGHPVLFNASLRPEFEALNGDDGGKPILAAHADRTCYIALPGDRARRDLDTPEMWASYRAETGL